MCSTGDKTGLQSVSRPVEQIVGAKICSKMFKKVMAPKLYKVWRLLHRQTCYLTSENKTGQIWPDFFIFIFSWSQLIVNTYLNIIKIFTKLLKKIEHYRIANFD